VINIIGGLAIGLLGDPAMSAGEAATTFTTLTIGDGLVSQVPAFLISLAAGFLVTRSTQKVDMPSEFVGQLFSRPQALVIAGIFLGVLVFTDLPTFPLLTIGGGCIGIAYIINKQSKEKEITDAIEARETAEKEATVEERIEDYLTIDPMEMEIGVGLIRLADPNRGGDLLTRITGVRQAVASDIGIVLPKVRIRDNMRLGENQYRIKIANNPVSEAEVIPEGFLAMNPGTAQGELPGHKTVDPAFGQPAVWIEPGMRDQAEMLGYTPVEPAAVLATHLQETVRKHADDILTRDATQHLVDELKQISPAVVEELIPGQLKLGEVQQVLQMLLREEVSIRQLGLILETLGDHASRTKDPTWLTEYVRNRLSRTLCSRYRDDDGALHVLTLAPALEDRISAGVEHSERGLFVRMSPQAVQVTCNLISQAMEALTIGGHPPIVLVSPQIRPGLKQMTAANLPKLIVLSYNEVTRDTKIESHGVVNDATN